MVKAASRETEGRWPPSVIRDQQLFSNKLEGFETGHFLAVAGTRIASMEAITDPSSSSGSSCFVRCWSSRPGVAGGMSRLTPVDKKLSAHLCRGSDNGPLNYQLTIRVALRSFRIGKKVNGQKQTDSNSICVSAIDSN